MIYRLMMLIGAALLLLGEPALADFSLRLDNPRGHSPAISEDNYDCYAGGAFGDYDYDPWVVESYGYPPFVGPYGPYPIVPAPLLGQAPTVVPPLIARPVSPQPRILLRLRDGTMIAVPNPRIRRLLPQNPDFLTNGSAYYPTPTYPLTAPYARQHRHPRYHHER